LLVNCGQEGRDYLIIADLEPRLGIHYGAP
jgi:hypothetical protein